MNNILSPPVVVKKYLKEIQTKFGLKIELATKQESKLLSLVTPVIKLFNPNYDRYITTLGNTIYFPSENWFNEKSQEQALDVVSHETKHILDFNNHKISYVAGYGFPQLFCFPVMVLVLTLSLLLGFSWLWCLLGLVLLAPLPSWWRMKHEVDAYVVSFIISPIMSPGEGYDPEFLNTWIVERLSQRWYYWAWPFPSTIDKLINQQKNLFVKDSFYSHLIDFCYRNHTN